MKTSTYYDSVELNLSGVTMLVEYEYDCDKGYYRNANGDGLPPSYTLDVISVYVGSINIIDFLLDYAPQAFKSIEDAVYESINP